MSDEGSGKTGHVVGVGVIGFGAIFARVADDCGRVGMRGASLLDDGARFGADRPRRRDAGREFVVSRVEAGDVAVIRSKLRGG